ncbi:MAG TPA: protein phosphatase 2C domain-containing protein [Micromonosporaceae bacterium]|nr:protein phosphatase 2C domain-containing protein [Micromonosporaceae bacterium]
MPSPSGRTSAPTWRVVTADATGAHHIANGMVHEDAWAVHPTGAQTADEAKFAVAVADGHGHARHFRSSTGSKLAVKVASEMGSALAGELAGESDGSRVDSVLRGRFGPGLVATWRDEVDKHLRANPVTPEEHSAAGLPAEPTFDDLLYGYGATLLVAVAAGQWLLCLQLGDGDFFLVAPDGTVNRPLPIDPRLDGLRTTSLCQPDAVHSIRYAVVPLAERSVGAVMLATDGYGNAQARNDWEEAFGADLAGLAKDHGTTWVGEQLPSWVRQCASSEGSGDDVTVALLFASGAKWAPAPRRAPSESFGDTLPDVKPSEATVRTATAAGATVPVAAPVDVGSRTMPNVAGAPRQPTTPGAGRIIEAEPPTMRIGNRARTRGSDTAASLAASPTVTAAGPGRHSATEPPPPARSSRRTLVILATAAAIVLVAVIIMLFVVFSGGEKGPAAPPKSPSPSPSTSLTSSTGQNIGGVPGRSHSTSPGGNTGTAPASPKTSG